MNVARGAIIDGIGRVPYDCTTIIIKVMIKVQLKAPQNKSSVDLQDEKNTGRLAKTHGFFKIL